jgi:hypothetical protein
MEHKVCLRCDASNSGNWTHRGENDCLDFTTNLDCTICLYEFPVKALGPFMFSFIVYLVFFFTRRGFPNITGYMFCPSSTGTNSWNYYTTYIFEINSLSDFYFLLFNLKMARVKVRVMVFSATFNNMSVILRRSVLLAEET